MNESLEAFFNRLLNARLNSLAAYILAAEPYIEPTDEGLLAAVTKIAQDDKYWAHEMLQLMDSLQLQPRVGTHDAELAELNYLSLRYLSNQLALKLDAEIQTLKEAADLVRGFDKIQELEQLLVQQHGELSSLLAASA